MRVRVSSKEESERLSLVERTDLCRAAGMLA